MTVPYWSSVSAGQDDHTDVAVALPTLSLDPGTQLGEYVIERKIGEGAMGVVFVAVHPTIGKRCAIKVLRAELCEDDHQIQRFIDEARAVNQIGHPNIVDIFAFGEMPDGRRYFAMEWLKGETLGQRLARGPLTAQQMSDVIHPLARALEAAHDVGIIHRDLKPENIFLVATRDEVPDVKLLDFGVAKLNNDAQRMYKTGAGEVVGTPMYIAPEQARGGDGVGPAADLYSLGAIAFECLCGRPPFLYKNVFEVITAHLVEVPVAPSTLAPGLGRELDALILAMLEKEPVARPSLAVVRAALAPAELAQAPLTTVRPVVAPIDAPDPPPARRGLAIALGAVVVIGAAALVFALLRSTAERSSDAPAPADAPTVAVAIAPPPPDAPVVVVVVDAGVPVDATGAVAEPVKRAPPRVGHVVVIAKGAASATFSVDGKRVAGARLDTQLAFGPHTVTVEANGTTRTLHLDVTARGLTRTVELPPPVDDRGLMRPGTVKR